MTLCRERNENVYDISRCFKFSLFSYPEKAAMVRTWFVPRSPLGTLERPSMDETLALSFPGKL